MSLSNTYDRPPISLKFVVVGGGIAGLAAAFTLRRAGHSVIVLEKRDDKSMSFGVPGGGIRAAYNMTKLLDRWGLRPIVSEKGRRCDKIVISNGNTGQMIGSNWFHKDLLGALIPEIVLLQHADFIKILYDLAVREGVEVRRNANVIHVDPNRVSAELESGGHVSGDVIVAADGYVSRIRSNTMVNPTEASGDRVLLVAFTVEMNLVKDDECLQSMLDPANWMTWSGEGIFIQTYIMQGGEYLVGTMSRNYDGPEPTDDDYEWSERDLESYGLDFTALEPRLQKILKLSKTVASRTFVDRPTPEDFVNDCSSIVFVGQSTHPFLCDASYGTALVIEDAETLGVLFSRIRCREQIKQMLTAYEDLRSKRCRQIYEHYKKYHEVYKWDTIWSQTFAYGKGEWPDDKHEGEFQSSWRDFLGTVGYDVDEAVEDWWVTWGSFFSPDEKRLGATISVSVKSNEWIDKI